MTKAPTLPRGLTRRRFLATAAAAALTAGLFSGARPLMAAEPIKTAGIYTVPVEQQWVSRIHKAAVAAQERGDIDYAYSENVSNTDYARVMREYAESGYALIIGEAFAVEQEAREVAAEYPEIAFLLGSSFKPEPDLPNFAVFDNYIQDASYLTGIIAGSLSESGNIGLIGGFPIPEVNRLMHAFMAGVRETNPDATFQVSFIGSWFDPPAAKETAYAMIENGADMLYAERFGVSDAAQEKGVLAIGNVIDTQADYPDTVVASAIWNFEPTLNMAISQVQAGTFKAEDYGRFSMMKEGGAELAPLGTFAGKVPQEAMDLVEQRKGEIMSGDYVTEINDEEPKSN
ncbi:BMP family protein [Roseovarius sp. S4756]|uniref:BMP family protein n=1 Tax=Roseovarius maritimus TaxID=3342637 RepID=UPI003726F470